MIDIIVARLLAQHGLANRFERVEPAFSALPVREYSEEVPAAFVMPIEESPVEANRMINCVNQRIRTVIGVHIVCQINDQAECADMVRDALMGWRMDLGPDIRRTYEPMEFLGGGIDTRDGVLGDTRAVQGRYVWWLERFVATFARH